jgi:lipoprotein-releasing system permease protein
VNVPLALAWRYIRRPTDRIVSAGGLVSLLGLIIGVMALVISMALMTGYREDLERKILGGNAELLLFASAGKIENPEQLARSIEKHPLVEQVTPAIYEGALVSSEKHATGQQVMLKGITIPPPRAPMMIEIVGRSGTLTTAEGTAGIAVGSHLAAKLGVSEGDPLTITVPTENSGSFLPRTRRFVITNVFSTGFFEFDSRWSFIELDAARDLLGKHGLASVLEIKVHDDASIDQAIGELKLAVGLDYGISDWREANRQLFSLLAIQQLALFIVIGLIVLVSTFDIVSTLIMTIQEKKKEIGILISIGADRQMVRRIFVWYGTLVGVFGTALGLLGGVVVSWVITRYELVSFGPEIAQVYFVSSIPFITRPLDLAMIAAFALGVSWLATLVPSMRAARLKPADALRYE